MKNLWKIHQQSITKWRCRKVSENDAKIKEKASKMEPKGLPKGDQIEVKIEVWKSSKFSEKDRPRAIDFEVY